MNKSKYITPNIDAITDTPEEREREKNKAVAELLPSHITFSYFSNRLKMVVHRCILHSSSRELYD